MFINHIIFLIFCSIHIDAQQTTLQNDVSLSIKQKLPAILAQYKLNNPDIDFYYNIIVKDINFSIKDQLSSLYLKVLVSSFQIDDTKKLQDVEEVFKGKLYQDYDGFALKQNIQTIKYKQIDLNPIHVSIYLYDKNGKLAVMDPNDVYKQSQNNYCTMKCEKGQCNQSFMGCDCPSSLGGFYFDRQCKFISTSVDMDIENVAEFSEEIKYFNLDITNLDESYSLLVSTTNPTNTISFLVYDKTYKKYSIPNLLDENITFQASKTKEFIFSQDWIVKNKPDNQSERIKVIFALYNMQKSQTRFTLKFYANTVQADTEDIPSWAMYLFVALAILGAIFMISVIFAIVKGSFRRSSSRRHRIHAIFITPDIIEKYMPNMLFKETELKKEEHEECTICLEGYKEDDKIRISICGHVYHMDCIDKWLIAHTSCPYCRQELTQKELEIWLQKKVQEQLQKQEQKELKSMMIAYLAFIENNQNIKKILKDNHIEEKQKRSFLSISNNNANLKKNFPDNSSISSIQTKQVTGALKIQSKQPKSSRQSKNKKQKKLQSQSFNLGFDRDVNLKDLVDEDILNQMTSFRNQQVTKEDNKQDMDDYNFTSNILQQNTDKSEKFNLMNQQNSKNMSKQKISKLQSNTEDNIVQNNLGKKNNDLERDVEDYNDFNLGAEYTNEVTSQLESQVNLRNNKKKNKRNQNSQISLINNESNKSLNRNQINEDKFEQKLQNSHNLQNQANLSKKQPQLLQHGNGMDADISFGMHLRKDIYENQLNSQENIEYNGQLDTQIQYIDNKTQNNVYATEQNTSIINNSKQDLSSQQLKQPFDQNNYKDNHKYSSNKNYPQEINEMDLGIVED